MYGTLRMAAIALLLIASRDRAHAQYPFPSDLSPSAGDNPSIGEMGESGMGEVDAGDDPSIGDVGEPAGMGDVDAGDDPSIGGVGIPAGMGDDYAGDDPSIGDVGTPAGEGDPDAGDDPSVGMNVPGTTWGAAPEGRLEPFD